MAQRYWQNFKDLREAQGLSQEVVAQRLGLTRQGNLPTRELHDQGVPKKATVERHAKALECQPEDLMKGVELPHDKLRGAPASTPPSEDGGGSVQSPEAQILLRRIEREQAKLATLRTNLGQKVGEIIAQLADLTTLISRIPGGQAAVARRRGTKDAPHRRRHRGRTDRQRPPKAPPE